VRASIVSGAVNRKYREYTHTSGVAPIARKSGGRAPDQIPLNSIICIIEKIGDGDGNSNLKARAGV
jgi:hypothetical protein